MLFPFNHGFAGAGFAGVADAAEGDPDVRDDGFGDASTVAVTAAAGVAGFGLGVAPGVGVGTGFGGLPPLDFRLP